MSKSPVWLIVSNLVISMLDIMVLVDENVNIHSTKFINYMEPVNKNSLSWLIRVSLFFFYSERNFACCFLLSKEMFKPWPWLNL